MMSGSEFSTSTSVSRTLFLMLWKLRDINIKVFRFCAFGGAGSIIGDDMAHGLPIEEHGLHGASGLVVERLLYELSSTEMELYILLLLGVLQALQIHTVDVFARWIYSGVVRNMHEV